MSTPLPSDFPGLDLEAWDKALPMPDPQSEDFELIRSVEPISKAQWERISRSLGVVQSVILCMGEVDLKAGAGVIGPTKKCLWTKDGRRITLDMQFGGFVGSITDKPDPAKPSAVPKSEPPPFTLSPVETRGIRRRKERP